MTWSGMSIPTLPGGLKRPRSQHPGAKNIEREKDELPLPEKLSEELDDKPSIAPASKSRVTEIPHRKQPVQKK